MSKKQSSPQSKARPSVISVRPDHKLRYLMELAARHDQRPLSNYIEWAIKESFSRVVLEEGHDQNHNYHRLDFGEIAEQLWSPDEAERLIRLAVYRPELMEIHEQEIWKMLFDSSLLDPAIDHWKHSGEPAWDLAILIKDIAPKLRDLWEDLLEAHAAGWNAQREWVAKTKEELQKKAASGNEAPQQKEDAPWDPNDPSLEDLPF